MITMKSSAVQALDSTSLNRVVWSSKGLTALEMKEREKKILSINIQIDLGGVELIEIETKKVSSLFHNLTFKCAGVG